MDETETSDKQQTGNNAKPWLFKKGQSGNPMGRPPGRSLKDRAKAYLSGLTDEEAEEFWEGMNKKDVWEMAEGKAKQDVEAKVQGTLVITFDESFKAKDETPPSPEESSK